MTEVTEEKILQLQISLHQQKERLDVYLSRQLPSLTRAKLKKLIDEEKVVVDGKPSKAGHLVRPGETICIHFPPVQSHHLLPESVPLEIVYEDPYLLVVNKAAGMVVHPAYGNMSGTLVNALLAHCQSLSSVGGDIRPGLVHRLDKDTSGLLVVAKDDVTHVALARQLSEHKMEREYRAIVWGRPKQHSGKIEAALARNPKDRTRMMIQADGKPAVTHYQVLEGLGHTSYLQLNLETGRTHQIRVHLASLGHPVFGDATYGGRGKQLSGLNRDQVKFFMMLFKSFDRQMLHARVLSFVHPKTGEYLKFESAIPQDMIELLKLLRNTAV